MYSINNMGYLHLILGCMYSGKTTELINRYTKYTIGGKKCLMIKYKNDTRYDNENVTTHSGIKINGFVCDYLFQANNLINDYDVICIDEIQFYNDAHIFCDLWALKGKLVEVSGLNGTFERKPFPIISLLIPLAEKITFLTAVCKENGKKAYYSKLINSSEVDDAKLNNNYEIIGGENIYVAANRCSFFNTEEKITEHKKLLLDKFNVILKNQNLKNINNFDETEKI